MMKEKFVLITVEHESGSEKSFAYKYTEEEDLKKFQLALISEAGCKLARVEGITEKEYYINHLEVTYWGVAMTVAMTTLGIDVPGCSVQDAIILASGKRLMRKAITEVKEKGYEDLLNVHYTKLAEGYVHEGHCIKTFLDGVK